jgi:hypothetical protein
MGHQEAEISLPVTPKPSVAGVDLTSVYDLRIHSRIYGAGRRFKGNRHKRTESVEKLPQTKTQPKRYF